MCVPCLLQSGPHITALLHYVTSDMCQVVVGGNASGMLFWHVTRPHQNGFVSLLSEQKHKTKITGLEVRKELPNMNSETLIICKNREKCFSGRLVRLVDESG